jgi:hypothetical protein
VETLWLDCLTLLLSVSKVIGRSLFLFSRWGVDQLQEPSLTCDAIFQLAVSGGKNDNWRDYRIEWCCDDFFDFQEISLFDPKCEFFSSADIEPAYRLDVNIKNIPFEIFSCLTPNFLNERKGP